MAEKIIIIKNIGSIINIEKDNRRLMSKVSGEASGNPDTLDNAFLVVENDIIAGFGEMAEMGSVISQYETCDIEYTDAGGGLLLPSFCDSHTHLVFPYSREREFEYRLNGLTYEEISAKGGGILNSAKAMDSISDEEILEASFKRINGIIATGTGTVEIKSGYGLTLEKELRLLRIIRKLAELSPVTVRSTFLGAHAIPAEYKSDPERYISIVTEEMMPLVAEEGLAQYADVFCEKGFFNREQSERIFDAAIRFGLKPRIHANQLSDCGAIDCAVSKGCISADHLEVLDAERIAQLASSDVIATLLPGCAFFMDSDFPKAKDLISAGATVAIASDYNPGTSPSGDMLFMMALGCIKMKMTPLQALMASTINGAAALELSHRKGSIAIGKDADFFITKKIPSLAYIPYSYTENPIERVFLKGKEIRTNNI